VSERKTTRKSCQRVRSSSRSRGSGTSSGSLAETAVSVTSSTAQTGTAFPSDGGGRPWAVSATQGEGGKGGDEGDDESGEGETKDERHWVSSSGRRLAIANDQWRPARGAHATLVPDRGAALKRNDIGGLAHPGPPAGGTTGRHRDIDVQVLTIFLRPPPRERPTSPGSFQPLGPSPRICRRASARA
jgi:hypothetical protein